MAYVEELGEHFHTRALLEPETFQDAHVEVKEWIAAHAVAAGDVAVNDGAVIVVIAIVLRVRADHRREWRTGTRERDGAYAEAVRQIKDSVQPQRMPDVILRGTCFEFRQQRIERCFTVEIAFLAVIIAVPRQSVAGLELQAMAQALVYSEIKSVIARMSF